VVGKIVKSEGKNQVVELRATEAILLGACVPGIKVYDPNSSILTMFHFRTISISKEGSQIGDFKNYCTS
jgi:chemotaxis receptor (MCP) glutamine deamidase CheD